ncbi:PRC-barrel domain-containing protein, partial [Gordonia sp. HY442]|uniref:PRC-barrel domain-containing protein n=1 Tax=Gordonia zhenghanii TaxID=2911516 RepID=UPI001F3F7B6C
LRGTLFVVDAADVDSGDDPDEFYDHELEGARVVTVDGVDVGVLESILHLPGGDVLAVRAADKREVLVPFVRSMVPTVTPERIEIDPPEGLLDLDAAVSDQD